MSYIPLVLSLYLPHPPCMKSSQGGLCSYCGLQVHCQQKHSSNPRAHKWSTPPTSLASQPHSVLQHWSLSVSACRGRVWRLRTDHFAWTYGMQLLKESCIKHVVRSCLPYFRAEIGMAACSRATCIVCLSDVVESHGQWKLYCSSSAPVLVQLKHLAVRGGYDVSGSNSILPPECTILKAIGAAERNGAGSRD